MAKPGAYIRDVHSLEQLNGRITSSGERMASIDQNVNIHLNGVRDKLVNQLNYLQQRMNEAEAKLREAESAMNACHASQMIVPETGMLIPSCVYEESAVSSAQIELENWKTKYNRGQQIFEECQQEIEDYSSGGHALIMNMSQMQTPKANQLLSGHIERLQDVLKSELGPSLVAGGVTGAIIAALSKKDASHAENIGFGKFNLGRAETTVSDNGMPGGPRGVLSSMDEKTFARWHFVEKNNKELEKALGVKRGRPMSISEADMQKANPHYGEKKKYGVNCATVVNAYALRLLGYDVTAKGKSDSWHNQWVSTGDNVFKVWKNIDGNDPQVKYTKDWMSENCRGMMLPEDYKQFFEETCKDKGVYILSLNWEGDGGHATILQRDDDGLHLIEPQVFEGDRTSDGRRSIDDLFSHKTGLSRYPSWCNGIMRVDDKIFNPEYADMFNKG